ncbi:MAG: 2-dehydropantoate 2-reductase [Acidiphilium sp.]
MRLLVIGAGSTGGYFGARLAQAGRDVTFLVRPGRAADLRANGLRVKSPHGDIALTPKLAVTGEPLAPFDAVLLTVKAFALKAAMADMAAAVGPETMILPVLNGMKHVDMLVERFGGKPVIGGVCRIAATLDAEGRIVQLASFHELAYGEMDGSASARTDALDAFMRGAGFDAKLSRTIEREMWEKWVFLATLGAVTCLMRGTIGEIVTAQGGAEFVNRVLDEIVAVATASGGRPSAETTARSRTMLTTAGSPLTSSMYRDLEAGSLIEAEQIIGDLVMRGRAAGLSTPLLDAVFAHLSVYQNRKSAG